MSFDPNTVKSGYEQMYLDEVVRRERLERQLDELRGKLYEKMTNLAKDEVVVIRSNVFRALYRREVQRIAEIDVQTADVQMQLDAPIEKMDGAAKQGPAR